MSLLGDNSNNLPKQGGITIQPGEFLLNPRIYFSQRVTITSAARDAVASDGSTARTPSTQLRKGLVMGKITATGKYAQYNPQASDGTQTAVGLLLEPVSVVDRYGNAVDALGETVFFGYVDGTQCYGLDAAAKTAMKNIIFA